MPAAVIGRQIAVDKLRYKIPLAAASVDKQILDKKTGAYHSQPIVHPAGLRQLPHGGIQNGITGTPCAPGVEQIIILSPGPVARSDNKRLMALEITPY